MSRKPKFTPPGRCPLPANWQTRQVNIDVVGCGGTGAHVVTYLTSLDLALRALGHPYGLHVTVYDPDTVSDANIGRQPFYRTDVGMPKASILLSRLNAGYGLDWKAVIGRYPAQRIMPSGSSDILISCVDTVQARREIAQTLHTRFPSSTYWLDCGNGRDSGQVFITRTWQEPSWVKSSGIKHSGSPDADPLPMLSTLLPEIFYETFVEDDGPSCSMAEALEKQGLFINKHIALWAVGLLETWFRDGYLDVCGFWINRGAGFVRPEYVPASKPLRKRPTGGKV